MSSQPGSSQPDASSRTEAPASSSEERRRGWRKKWWIVGAILLGAAAASSFWFFQTEAPRSSWRRPEMGEFVVRTEDGEPVAGADVIVVHEPFRLRVATSDAHGRFRAAKVGGTSRFEIALEREGAARLVGSIAVPERGSGPEPFEFTVRPEAVGRLRVTAVDEAGAPVFCTVLLRRLADDYERIEAIDRDSHPLEYVPTGDYEVRVASGGARFFEDPVTQRVSVAEGEVAEVAVVLDRLVSVTIEWVSGAPIAHLVESLDSGRLLAYREADDSEPLDLRPGEPVRVVPIEGSFIATVGAEFTVPEMGDSFVHRVTVLESPVVHGRVTFRGQPVAFAEVRLPHRSPEAVTTGESGEFRVEPSCGRTHVVIEASACWEGRELFGSTTVDLSRPVDAEVEIAIDGTGEYCFRVELPRAMPGLVAYGDASGRLRFASAVRDEEAEGTTYQFRRSRLERGTVEWITGEGMATAQVELPRSESVWLPAPRGSRDLVVFEWRGAADVGFHFAPDPVGPIGFDLEVRRPEGDPGTVLVSLPRVAGRLYATDGESEAQLRIPVWEEGEALGEWDLPRSKSEVTVVDASGRSIDDWKREPLVSEGPIALWLVGSRFRITHADYPSSVGAHAPGVASTQVVLSDPTRVSGQLRDAKGRPAHGDVWVRHPGREDSEKVRGYGAFVLDRIAAEPGHLCVRDPRTHWIWTQPIECSAEEAETSVSYPALTARLRLSLDPLVTSPAPIVAQLPGGRWAMRLVAVEPGREREIAVPAGDIAVLAFGREDTVVHVGAVADGADVSVSLSEMAWGWFELAPNLGVPLVTPASWTGDRHVIHELGVRSAETRFVRVSAGRFDVWVGSTNPYRPDPVPLGVFEVEAGQATRVP